MKTVINDFKIIVEQEKTMKSFSETPRYYDEQDKLKDLLVKFLRTEFTTLPMKKFLHLCDMASAYRPVAPFSFLVSISIRHDKKISHGNKTS